MNRKVGGYDLNARPSEAGKSSASHIGDASMKPALTWTAGQQAREGRLFQEVWFTDDVELDRRAADPRRFVVALANARRDCWPPRRLHDVVGPYKVVATRALLGVVNAQTNVRRRVEAI